MFDLQARTGLQPKSPTPGWGRKDTSIHRQPFSISVGECRPLGSAAHLSSPHDVGCGVGPDWLQETTSNAILCLGKAEGLKSRGKSILKSLIVLVSLYPATASALVWI